MDGVVAYILGKSYTKKSLIGIGALAGAPCQVQSITKVDKTTTITLKWVDNEGGVHTQSFDVLDGEDGISVVNATITPSGHLELTLSNGNVIDCGKILPQYDTIPTASASNVGQILQYIGSTNVNYTNGYFYKCINDGGVYKWIAINTQDSYTKSEIGDLSYLPDSSRNIVENIIDLNNNKENKFRVFSLPTPTVDYVGKIYQYIGDNTQTLTNGYYYQCKEVSPNVYQWVQKNVQPTSGSGGNDNVVEGYFNSINNLFYEESTYTTPIIGESNVIYISLDTNLLYRYNGLIFIRVDNEDNVGNYGIVELVTDLPSTFGASDRKIYFVIEENSFYLWQGTSWEIQQPKSITDTDIDRLFD